MLKHKHKMRLFTAHHFMGRKYYDFRCTKGICEFARFVEAELFWS